MGTSYAGNTFNFVPNGAAVTVTRDVIRHGELQHLPRSIGISRWLRGQGLQMCVLCHQPQNADPDLGNSLDAKVFFHKIHMGSQLPSVMGTSTTPGVPYQIYGYMNSANDFSTVMDPANPQPLRSLPQPDHQQAAASQRRSCMPKPSRAACGACHDDVNFATGANHPGGIQADDTQCTNCHVPQGELPFDASIMGAHVVPTDTAATYPQNPDTLLAGINLAITSVTNTNAGQKPTVNFTLQDNKGNNIAVSSTTTLSFTMAGPTTDYGYTSFGSDTASTPGYVTESA